MRWWPFRKPDPEKTQQANAALKEADESLSEARERGREVEEVTDHIRKYREENGFSGMFREAMRRA